MTLRKMAMQIAADIQWEDVKVAEPADVMPEPLEEIAGVKIYCVIEVLDGIFGEDADSQIPYEEKGKAIQAWCEAHGALSYAEPREDYDTGEAAQQALDAGLDKVVADDLS